MADKLPFVAPWPVSGIDKGGSWRDQKDDTCISALNVRNQDVLDSRARGGTRPGLCKEYEAVLGSGAPVRTLGRVATAKDSRRYRWLDDFARDTLGSSWATASWIGTAPSVKASFDSSYADNSTSGAVCQALNFATTSPYIIELYVVPWLGAHWATYKIFARMDNTTQVATTDGIIASLALSGTTGAYTGTLVSYVSGVATTYNFTAGNQTTAKPAWFRVHITSNTVTCTLGSATLVTQAVSAHTGKRVGFGITSTATYPTGLGLVDCFRVLGAPLSAADSPDYSEYLVAISNGSLTYSSNLEVMTAATGDPNDFATDRNLLCTELFQKVYVADWAEVCKAGTGGVTNGSPGTTLDDSSVTDWTALGIDKDTHVVVIASGTGATAGTYEIASIHSTNGLTLTASPGTSASSIVYRVARCPKVFDPTTGAVTRLIATAGQVPNECPIICTWNERIVLAGAAAAPQVYYMSAKAAPTDWDYATTDAGRAFASTSDTGAGAIGVPITAMFAASNDNCVFAAKDRMGVLRGEPTAGGRLDTISDRVGIIGPQAWCK
jgi:hypothetical protein